MSLETYTGYIKDMVDTNPSGGDPKSQGDDHLRGIKYTLQVQFAGLTTATPVSVTAEDINSVTGKVNRAGDTMTGPLTVNGLVRVFFPPDQNAEVSAGGLPGDGSRRVAMVRGIDGSDGVASFDSAGNFKWIARGVTPGAGAMSLVAIGTAGVALLSDSPMPSAGSGGNEIATCAWVRAAQPTLAGRQLLEDNTSDTGVGGGDVLLAQTPVLGTRPGVDPRAAGVVSINSTGAGEIVLTLKLFKGDGTELLARAARASTIGTPFTYNLAVAASYPVVGSGIAPGDTVRWALFVRHPGGGNVPAYSGSLQAEI